MASGAKKPTTIAKLRRENAVWERRLRKQAKKHARKRPSEAPAVLPREPSPAMGLIQLRDLGLARAVLRAPGRGHGCCMIGAQPDAGGSAEATARSRAAR